jgi:hypothetical protein
MTLKVPSKPRALTLVGATVALMTVAAACVEPPKPDGGTATTTAPPPPSAPACPTIANTAPPATQVSFNNAAPNGNLSGVVGTQAAFLNKGWWAQNDRSGNNDIGGPETIQLFPANLGAPQTIQITGSDNFDWEDIDSLRGASGARIYLSDMGDNPAYFNPALNAPRRNQGGDAKPVKLYWFEEGAVNLGAGTVPLAGSMTVSFGTDRRNVEATFVDQRTGDYWMITKSEVADGNGEVYRIPAASIQNGANVTATLEIDGQTAFADVDNLGDPVTGGSGLTEVTGAEMSPNGNMLVVKTNRRWFIWTRGQGAGTGVKDMLSFAVPGLGDACSSNAATATKIKARRFKPAVGGGLEPSLGGGEAIGWSADGTLLATVLDGGNEGLGMTIHFRTYPVS